MAFDFPASPSIGQAFTPSGGPTYKWNGYAWAIPVSPSLVFAGIDPPPSPSAGQLWWESDSGKLVFYYDDGNTQQWVEVPASNIDTSAFVTSAQLTTTLANYLPLTGGALTGALTGTTITLSGALTALGVQSTGDTVSNQNFVSSTTAAVFAAQSGGAVYLRPNGKSSTSGQFYVTTNGDAYCNGVSYIVGDANAAVLYFMNGGTSRAYIQSVNSNASGFLQFTPRDSTGTSTGALTLQGNTAVASRTLEWNGNNANKAVAGSWTATSDARIKEVHGDYLPGLPEILALQPKRFHYRGNDFTRDPAVPLFEETDKDGNVTHTEMPQSPHQGMQDVEIVGLIAQEAEVPMPDIVRQKEGWIDGQHVTDLRDLDPTNITYALINAVKTLEARVRELEAR